MYPTMRLLVIMILLHVSLISCKRKYRSSSSEESIENVLYYQDCKHKRENEPLPKTLRGSEATPKKPQECKMACTMCCGEECQQTYVGKSMKPNFQQQAFLPKPPQMFKPQKRPIRRPSNVEEKKNFDILPSLIRRRDFSLTKDNIKNLISQDGDIRKILKDLVRVTMQKVDLMQIINEKRNEEKREPAEDGDSDL